MRPCELAWAAILAAGCVPLPELKPGAEGVAIRASGPPPATEPLAEIRCAYGFNARPPDSNVRACQDDLRNKAFELGANVVLIVRQQVGAACFNCVAFTAWAYREAAHPEDTTFAPHDAAPPTTAEAPNESQAPLPRPAASPPPEDPLSLQRTAVGRIETFLDLWRRTGDKTSRNSDLAQADSELATGNRVLEDRGDWKALAAGLIRQGEVHRIQADWPGAIALYQKAAEAAARGGHAALQAEALAWQGFAESSRGQRGPALELSNQAARVAATSGDVEAQFQAEDILGRVQLAQGDVEAATDSANRAVALAERLQDSLDRFFAYLDRSDAYIKASERCSFRATYDECSRELDVAGADLQKAGTIARDRGYTALVGATNGFLRELVARRAILQSSKSLATDVDAEVFRPKQAGDVITSDTYVSRGKRSLPPELLGAYQNLKRLERVAGGQIDALESASLYFDGLTAQMQGDEDAALDHFRRAVDALERDRRSLRDESGRGRFMESRIELYYAPIKIYLQRHRYADAFDLLERSRSRALADLLEARRPTLGRAVEQKLYSQWVTLRTRIATLQSEQFDLAVSSTGGGDAAKVSTLQADIRALGDEQAHLAARIATEAPQLASLVDSRTETLAALQRSMRTEHYELLQYLVLPTDVIVWYVGPDSVFVRRVWLPRAALTAKLAALRESLGDPHGRFDEATARELFLFLIQPVLAHVHGPRLVIIPHEDLHSIPFQALQDPSDGRFLGERFQISYGPSATVLLRLRRSTALGGGRLLAIADPSIDGAASEVTAIAQLFRGQKHVESEALASKAELASWVRGADVIHLAVHGEFQEGDPLLSRLELRPDGAEDGHLTAAEMFALQLRRSPLVVLSACESGRAEATHGNELLGITRALLYAGANTLVLSSWKVDSRATALWMRAFYESARTRPPAEAARAALLALKREPAYSQPFYWAAFEVIGR